LLAGTVAVTTALLLGLAGTSLAAAWAMREREEARDAEAVARDQLARSQRLLSYAASPIAAAKDPGMLYDDWRAVIESVQEEASEDDVGRVRMEGLYAAWLANTGMSVEAGAELDRVYGRVTRILGRDDMVRLIVVNAEIVRKLGVPAELPDLYAELLGCMEGVFGADAQATLEIRLEYACVLARCGWNAEATVALRDYLDRQEADERGPTPTSAVRAKAAVVAFTTPPVFIPDDVMGRLLRNCYRGLRPADGVGDDQFVAVGRTYGRWLWDRKRYAEGELVYAVLLDSHRKRPVQDPTAILAILQKLGGCMLRNGRAAEAEPLLREGLSKTIEYNGEGHYYSHAARGWLGECLVAMKKYEEAEPLLLAAHEGAILPGAEPDERRLACERLAAMYEAMDRPEEAKKWTERVRDGG
jgi:tetratricopeptide (TPR) repeat protein